MWPRRCRGASINMPVQSVGTGGCQPSVQSSPQVGTGTERERGEEAGFMDSQAEEFLVPSPCRTPSGMMEPFPGGLGAAGGSGEAPDRRKGP